MKGRLLLDVIIRQGTPIFQLLSSKDEPLLVRWDTLLILDLRLDVVNGIRTLNLQSYSLSSQRLHKDLHTTTKTKNQMESRLLLDVVVSQSTAIFQLFASKDQPLLVWWDTLLILNLSFDIVNGVRTFNLQSDGLASQSLDKDLHPSSQPENKVQSGFLLDVVIGQGSAILELLSSEDEPLLVRWNTFLVLDFSFDIVNGVRALDFKGDCLSGESFDEDLHATTETEDQVESRLLLDVVVS
ncbi:hypothetical protein HanPSC8_Chr01g0006381 [Helianthus annuus]|nr:hypothetical protein HanPSC8_Chr01g0006381 [Helianthus annuus]